MSTLKRYERRFDEKAPKIVKHVLTGIHNYAKTFGIVTAENPMGKKISGAENKILNKELHNLLSRGRYQFVKIKGKYGNIENPVLILNISLNYLKDIGDMYNQESVIFGKINDYRDVTFEYWDRDSEGSPLKFKDSIDRIDVLSDPKDFYSRIKNWKFTIPFPVFQESLIEWYGKVDMLSDSRKNELQEYTNIMFENMSTHTGHHIYRLRGKINSLWKS